MVANIGFGGLMSGGTSEMLNLCRWSNACEWSERSVAIVAVRGRYSVIDECLHGLLVQIYTYAYILNNRDAAKVK